MLELEQRIKHLEKLLYQINLGERYELDFDKLYKLLKEEYRLEGGESGEYHMNDYRHSLEQTIQKQAHEYISKNKKRPVKGARDEYISFIRNFKHDVDDELTRCKYKLNPPTHD